MHSLSKPQRTAHSSIPVAVGQSEEVYEEGCEWLLCSLLLLLIKPGFPHQRYGLQRKTRELKHSRVAYCAAAG